MKTMWDESARRELVSRIGGVDAGKAAGWGKMNVGQMVRHCILFDEWMLGIGAHEYKQSLLGKVFGRMALKSSLKDAPMQRNMPSGAAFAVRGGDGNLEADKARWAGLIARYGSYSNPGFIHDFFGKMTEEQIGLFAYKHADHHLRQFGC